MAGNACRAACRLRSLSRYFWNHPLLWNMVNNKTSSNSSNSSSNSSNSSKNSHNNIKEILLGAQR